MRIGLGIGLNRFRGGQAGVVGLLDAYKGSAFAMSPDTLLYSTYSATDDVAGSVTNGDTGQFSVTVYRDSDNAMRSFTPAEVADGTANTWRSAAGAANGLVRRAYDQSVTALDVSNLNHANQTTTAAMPKLFDSSTGLILENGKAAMEFDGVDDRLSKTFSSNFTNPVSMFFVNKSTAISGQTGLFSSASAAGAFIKVATGYVFYQNGPQFSPSFGNNTQNLLYGTTSTNGLNWELAANGVLVVNGGQDIGIIGGNLISLLSRGNSSAFMLSTFQMKVLYPTDQSSNRTAIETAINNEYNIYPQWNTPKAYQ